jgi:hypothetical protein
MAEIDVEKLKKMAFDIAEQSKNVTFASNVADTSSPIAQSSSNSSGIIDNITNVNNVSNNLPEISGVKNTSALNVVSVTKNIDVVTVLGYVLPQQTFYLLLCLIAIGIFIYYKL